MCTNIQNNTLTRRVCCSKCYYVIWSHFLYKYLFYYCQSSTVCCVSSLHNQVKLGCNKFLCKDTMRWEENIFGKCFAFTRETFLSFAQCLHSPEKLCKFFEQLQKSLRANTKVLRGNEKFIRRTNNLRANLKFLGEQKIFTRTQKH